MAQRKKIAPRNTAFRMVLVLALALAFSVVIPQGAFASTSKYNDNYTKWKQYESIYAKKTAWSKADYPGSTLHTMKSGGCLVTSVSMLLRHYNVVTETNVDKFNPWVCNKKLKSVGAFNSSADLILSRVSKAYPGLQYVGSKAYSGANVYSLYKKGYAVVCLVNGKSHYIAVRKATSSKASDILVMDPGSTKKNMSKYSSKNKVFYFKVVKATHSMYFGLNGGTGTFSTIKVKDDDSFKLPTAKPTRSGYTFKGWYVKRLADSKWYVKGKGWYTWSHITSNNLTPAIYSPGATYPLNASWRTGSATSNYRFYAQWTNGSAATTTTSPSVYTFTFGLNEGSGNFPDLKVKTGDQIVVPTAIPTRSGYSFKGWYVKRVKDNVWYYSGHGWMNWDKAKAAGYTPTLYSPGRSMLMDSSWTTGCDGSEYRFYAQWG